MLLALLRGATIIKKLTFRWTQMFRIKIIELVKLLPSEVGGFLLGCGFME